MSLTAMQKRELLRIEEAQANGQPLHRPEVNAKVRNGLYDEDLVHRGGSMLDRDGLYLTDAGIERCNAIRTVKKLPIIGLPTTGDIRAAAAQGKDPFSIDGEPSPILGVDVPDREQLAEAEGQGEAWHGQTSGIDAKEIVAQGLTLGQFSYANRLAAEGDTIVQIHRAAGITQAQAAWVKGRTTTTTTTATKDQTMTQLLELSIGDLHPRPENLRQDANGDDLVPSIKAHGILQPLNITKNGDGYLINAGHRRLDGARKAGLMVVPCVISTIETESDVTMAMLIENLMRRDLDPIEEANGYQRLIDLGCTQKEVADHTGRSAAVISRRVSLLELPDAAHHMIRQGTLTLELAESYTRLPSDVQDIAVKSRWSEERVTDALNKAAEKAEDERLQAVVEKAGVTFIAPSRMGKQIRGADGWVYEMDGGHWNPTRIEEKELDSIAGRKNAVGVTIARTYVPAKGYQRSLIPVLKKKQAPPPKARHGADPKARHGADPKIREARQEHWDRFRDDVVNRKYKLADAQAVFVRTMVAGLPDCSGVSKQLGLPSRPWAEQRVQLVEHVAGLTGPELARALVLCSASLLDEIGEYQTPGPTEELVDAFTKIGWAPMPEAEPVS